MQPSKRLFLCPLVLLSRFDIHFNNDIIVFSPTSPINPESYFGLYDHGELQKAWMNTYYASIIVPYSSATLSVTRSDLLLHKQICRKVNTRLTAAYLYSGDFVRLLYSDSPQWRRHIRDHAIKVFLMLPWGKMAKSQRDAISFRASFRAGICS